MLIMRHDCQLAHLSRLPAAHQHPLWSSTTQQGQPIHLCVWNAKPVCEGFTDTSSFSIPVGPRGCFYRWVARTRRVNGVNRRVKNFPFIFKAEQLMKSSLFLITGEICAMNNVADYQCLPMNDLMVSHSCSNMETFKVHFPHPRESVSQSVSHPDGQTGSWNERWNINDLKT